MSLRFWLPLTKDLKNQGLSSIIPTQTSGFTKITTGKLGECYKFTSVFDTLLPLSEWDWTTQSVSFGCWAKISKTELSTLAEVPSYSSIYTTMGGTLLGRDSYGGIAIRWQTNNIYTDSVLNKLYVYTHIRNTNSQTNQTSSQEVPFDTWFHIMTVIDRNDSQIKLYLNGELVKSIALTVTGTFATGTFRIAEATWHGGNGNSSSGCWQLNDVRIYDHALSPLEVKHISQGLILHYPLNRGGWGQENLITGYDTSFLSYPDGAITLFNNQMNGGAQEIVSNIGGATKCLHLHSNGGNGRQYRTLSATSGKSYTISCDYYSTSSQAFPFRGELNGGNYSWAGSNAVAYTTPNKWVRLSFSYLNLTSDATIFYFMQCSQNTDCYIKNLKIEEGSIATPWCPNSSDALATILGMNDNIEYDCSGFGNNGTRTGTFSWTNNTPKYNVSTGITAGSGIFTPMNITFSQYTIAFWAKHTVGSKMLMGSCPSAGTSQSSWYWYGDNSFKYPSGEYYYTYNGGTKDSFKWTHFVATYDGTNVRVYRNGVSEGAKACTGDQAMAYLSIGYGCSSRYTENSNMSDFRVYATALSADDVKDLYELGAAIDTNNILYTYELNEV